jgi:hypothetical protein
MGSILLHNPGVQLYLLCVGALLIAFLWDYFHRPGPPRPDRRPVRGMRPPEEAVSISPFYYR